MVERRFNKPLARIQGNALYWLMESGSHCAICKKLRMRWDEPMTLGVEVFMKATTREIDMQKLEADNLKPPTERVSMAQLTTTRATGLVCSKFICLDCAEKTFDDLLARIRLLKAHGKDGYKLFEVV